jgi:hypothetical protein
MTSDLRHQVAVDVEDRDAADGVVLAEFRRAEGGGALEDDVGDALGVRSASARGAEE